MTCLTTTFTPLRIVISADSAATLENRISNIKIKKLQYISGKSIQSTYDSF